MALSEAVLREASLILTLSGYSVTNQIPYKFSRSGAETLRKTSSLGFNPANNL
jgi:hypothetical protein